VLRKTGVSCATFKGLEQQAGGKGLDGETLRSLVE